MNTPDSYIEPKGDIGALNLGDIIDREALQSMMEEFYKLTHILSAVLDLSGNILVAVGWQDICTKFHRCHPETGKNCLESDTLLSSGVPAGTFKTYRCKNNLWDMATPIEVSGRHIGNIFIGQFFYDNEVPDYDLFRRQAREYGFDETEYLAALDRVPRFSRETVDSAMLFFTKLAGMIASLSYSNISLASTISRQEAVLVELKKTGNELSEIKNLMDAVFEQSPIPMAVAQTSDAVLLVVNPACRKNLGLDHDLVGKSLIHTDLEWKTFTRDGREIPPGNLPLARAIQGETVLEEIMRVERKDGSSRWIEVSASPIFDKDGNQVAAQIAFPDITERKRAEEALRNSEENLSITLQSIGDGVISTDKNGRVVQMNPMAENLCGWTIADASGKPLSDVFRIVNAETREAVADPVKKVLESGKIVGLANHTVLISKNGSEYQIADSAAPIRTKEDETIGVVLVFSDVTEKYADQKKIRESDEDLKESQRIAHVGSWRLDISTHDVTWSEELYNMYGFDPSLPPPPFSEHHKLFTPESWKRLSKALPETIKTGIPYELELETVQPDGSNGWMWVRGEVVRDAKGATVGLRGAAQDITDRKQAEDEKTSIMAQLNQAQKIESVGRLAGGVAHDFNNMLGVILGHTDMILEKLDPTLPIYADLEEIRLAAIRSAELTRQLLAFARKQTVAPKKIELNKVVEGMLNMLHRLIGEAITINWLPGEDVGLVNMDPSQIDQLLINLCVNARDAIANVGQITIETESVEFDEDFCKKHAGFIPGKFVMLTVSDDGCGMNQETQANIFEPFFTTKDQGKGTGLGLATIYGIVNQNNGFINVYSELNQGSTFRIYLPRYIGKARLMHKPGVKIKEGQGHETILIVEDELSILKMTTMMLERQGYTVLSANTPDEAHRLARDYDGEIHLLMTDVIMPEMNGRDLAKNILTLYPNLKRLFMSGYTANVIAHHGVLDQGIHFIQKPFSYTDLVAKVKSVLGYGTDSV